MMRDISAIVYASNTGFTRRYAEMLSRAAAIPAYDLGNPSSLPEPKPCLSAGNTFPS